MSTTLTLDELEKLELGLIDACDRLQEQRARLAAEQELRDHLIVAAIDEHGMTQTWVAAVTGLSRAQVIRILCGSSAAGDDDD